mmetsp:Transcript_21516/g.32027  ORF Transcript_21516/g.32027 Transcript_21516/m.32027 type:complete len:539 (-) Transcript_21516:180-1796(-)
MSSGKWGFASLFSNPCGVSLQCAQEENFVQDTKYQPANNSRSLADLPQPEESRDAKDIVENKSITVVEPIEGKEGRDAKDLVDNEPSSVVVDPTEGREGRDTKGLADNESVSVVADPPQDGEDREARDQADNNSTTLVGPPKERGGNDDSGAIHSNGSDTSSGIVLSRNSSQGENPELTSMQQDMQKNNKEEENEKKMIITATSSTEAQTGHTEKTTSPQNERPSESPKAEDQEKTVVSISPSKGNDNLTHKDQSFDAASVNLGTATRILSKKKQPRPGDMAPRHMKIASPAASDMAPLCPVSPMSHVPGDIAPPRRMRSASPVPGDMAPRRTMRSSSPVPGDMTPRRHVRTASPVPGDMLSRAMLRSASPVPRGDTSERNPMHSTTANSVSSGDNCQQLKKQLLFPKSISGSGSDFRDERNDRKTPGFEVRDDRNDRSTADSKGLFLLDTSRTQTEVDCRDVPQSPAGSVYSSVASSALVPILSRIEKAKSQLRKQQQKQIERKRGSDKSIETEDDLICLIDKLSAAAEALKQLEQV